MTVFICQPAHCNISTVMKECIYVLVSVFPRTEDLLMKAIGRKAIIKASKKHHHIASILMPKCEFALWKSQIPWQSRPPMLLSLPVLNSC